MIKFTWDLPIGAKVVGALDDHPRLVDLEEDMLQIELRDEVFIHVGWYPARDPKGQYCVLVFRDTVDKILAKVETKSLTTAVAIVRANLGKYGNTYGLRSPISRTIAITLGSTLNTATATTVQLVVPTNVKTQKSLAVS